MSMNYSVTCAADGTRNRLKTEKVLKVAIEQSKLSFDITRDVLFDSLNEMEIPEADRDRLRSAIAAYVSASVDWAAICGALKAVRII